MPPKSSLPKPKYSEGEKILCFHGPLLYEAKCLGVETKESLIKYFVHYQGWNKNWDEWVGDARIMKFNAVGLQKQKELKELYSKPGKKVKGLRKSELMNQEYPPPEALRHLEEVEAHQPSPQSAPPTHGSQPQPQHPYQTQAPAAAAAAVAASGAAPGGSGGAVASKRSRGESTASLTGAPATSTDGELPAGAGTSTATAETAGLFSGVGGGGSSGGGRRLRIQIELPRLLKMWLSDDAELVARQRRLHVLPPPPGQTVSSILGRFVTIQAGSGGDEFERERLSEFVSGVQSYFNAVLSTQLLYAAERQQYSALLKGHRGGMPASLYGCVHLVRLFVRLGDLLSQTKLDLRCLNSLLDYCDTFLLFIERNMDTFAGTTSYEPAVSQSS